MEVGCTLGLCYDYEQTDDVNVMVVTASQERFVLCPIHKESSQGRGAGEQRLSPSAWLRILGIPGTMNNRNRKVSNISMIRNTLTMTLIIIKSL